MFYECHETLALMCRETLALIGWGLRQDGTARDWF
jgi:hypothetical protein